ncbi:hypothetical protein PENSPDRAFT_453921 [Peniophora sp. CONT]|nr:hypothetical protein PENSPDRAFT_453921 [Peniophora sp. CONT]
MATQPGIDWICRFCKSRGVALRCSQCKFTTYCDAECQKKDWKAHKVVCPKPDAARLEYIAIVEKTINAVAPLLDFENTPMTDPETSTCRYSFASLASLTISQSWTTVRRLSLPSFALITSPAAVAPILLGRGIRFSSSRACAA